MSARDVLAHLIGESIWGGTTTWTSPLSVDQYEECYRIADAVMAAGFRNDGGAAAPPAATTGAPTPAAAECATATAAPPSQTGPGPAATIGGQPGPVLPRVFEMYRHHDVTGKSGTGTVAWGTQWPDGTVALRWMTEHQSTVHWDSLAALIAVHGHSGATEVRWLDGPVPYWPAHEALTEPEGDER